ncbi:MAG: aminomethyl-transferring glycine dehydrogenase subunit GcvPB [Hyphomicrobiaceae bacterium]|nr:aminomethyl-transferring glycine dehydrogenase subunit GcvPB [Hyphomicrobiaceae bacterium]
MSMNRQGRQTQPNEKSDGSQTQSTHSGNRGLQIEEPLLFELGDTTTTGVDLPKLPDSDHDNATRFGDLARSEPIGLAGLSEPETMRHYVRLSQKNYSIDTGIYPLGSCTMKHNPRLNEKMARLPGMMDIHPLQPQSTVPGAIELMEELAHWLMELTNMQAIALSPKAGAHGELCGMMAIKAAHEHAGDSHRNIVLVPDSAHGTNPATAALIGYKVRSVPAQSDGTVTAASVKEALDENVAAIMLTNPNTGGVFEREIVEIAELIHEAGAYFYCDGANFNAIAGKVRPGDLGVDAMHFNLHKTFSTPHGGGGPGSGPVVLSRRLAPFAPYPFLQREGETAKLVENSADHAGDDHHPFGRMTAFHGQWGMYTRALTYMRSHGVDGLRQASEDAVLNANYVRACLSGHMSLAFGEDHICMHEVLFDDAFLKGTGVTTLDFAKAMIDEGFHPMTVYFPLIVHGAMLVEPTESESKASLDQFIHVMIALTKQAKEGQSEHFSSAPVFTPRGRLDETGAARKPILRWLPEKEMSTE